MMFDNTSTASSNMNGGNHLNKDPVKILYFDVTFQGNSGGGRLVLKSRSMTYYAATGERQGNIAWNTIAKLQSGATRNGSGAEYLLKILNHSNQSLTFGMQNESDLDRIRTDIQDCIQNYRRTSNSMSGGIGGGEEDSLISFPQFVDEDAEMGSTQQQQQQQQRNSNFGSGSPTSLVTGNRMMMESSMRSQGSDIESIFYDEQPQSLSVYGGAGSHTGGGSTSRHNQSSNGMKGEIVLEGKAVPPGAATTTGGGDASTIGGGSSAASGSSMISGDHPGNGNGNRSSVNTFHRQLRNGTSLIDTTNVVVDPEVAAADAQSYYSNNSINNKTEAMVRANQHSNTFSNTDAFRDQGDANVMPVASFRLVPDGNQAYYHPTATTKEDPWMMAAATSSCMPPYYYTNQNNPKKGKGGGGGGVCRSKWFWITLLLLALLFVGIAIGLPLGIFSSKRGNDNTKNTVVGLQDTSSSSNTINSIQPIILDEDNSTTTSPPSQAPTEEVVAAAERTPSPTTSMSPTTAPSTVPSQSLQSHCDHVGHDQSTNSQSNAVSAGSFGGSSYCRASILSLCEWTKWIPFNTYQGVGSTWFKATAIEDSFCVADIEHQIQLHVPEGVDYDLHVYHQTLANVMIPHDSSTVSGSHGNTEAVIISNDDGHLSDQSFQYYIQIEYKGGSSCEPWTLTLYGHQCL